MKDTSKATKAKQKAATTATRPVDATGAEGAAPDHATANDSKTHESRAHETKSKAGKTKDSQAKAASEPVAATPPADTSEPSADDIHAEADARVGAVVRAERLRRSWSLGKLAEQAMISTGMLSQIERGLATPSLRTLRLLAGALDVPITQFFAGDNVPPTANPFIVRANERHCLNLTTTGINKMFLMPPGSSLMEMWEFRFAPGGTSGGALYNHNGEKAGVVIKGRIKLLIGDDTYVLEEGDSFRFSSMLRHRVDNDSDEEARVIWVVTPPASGGRAPSRQ